MFGNVENGCILAESNNNNQNINDMTTQEAKAYKFEKVDPTTIQEGDVIKFSTPEEGTTIARVTEIYRTNYLEVTIWVKGLHSTQPKNWYMTSPGSFIKKRRTRMRWFSDILKATSEC